MTTFERTSWSVRRRDGSVIEVALDLGHIVAGDKITPICELELELLAGQPSALFDLAQQIARTIAVMPLNMSKSVRGYALTQDCHDKALRKWFTKPGSVGADSEVQCACSSQHWRSVLCRIGKPCNLC